MIHRQRFWLRSPSGAWTLLGENTRNWVEGWSGKGPPRPHGLAYFCQTCGDLWARVEVEAPEFYHCYSESCEAHDPGWRSFHGGTFWIDWDRWFNDALPRPVLLYDFGVMVRKLERLEKENRV